MTKDSIFVSIACLSDTDVIATVFSALRNAKYSDRIFFGVCLQAFEDDLMYSELDNISSVRLDRIPISKARGPIYARSRCEKLIESEEYFFQIDCHTRFFPDWDEILIEEFCKINIDNSKSILSHYPINIKNMNSDKHLEKIGHVNRYRHIGIDALKSHGSLITLPARPIESLGIHAAMLFMHSSDRLRHRYDPELNFGLHAAEQVLYAIRLWTNGFDIFCPTRHTIATDYLVNRDRISINVKRAYQDLVGNWPEITWSKVRFLLGLDSIEHVNNEYRDSITQCISNYTFEEERSLLDYYKFASIHEKLKNIFPLYKFSSF